MSSTDSSSSNGISLTRRKMVVIGGTGLIAGLAGTLAWPKISGRGNSAGSATSAASGETTPPSPTDITAVPASAVSAGDFTPFINSEFLIGSTAGETKCKLVSVSPEVRQETIKGTFVSFSILFEAPNSIPADGATCEVRHPEMKPMEIFLSPVGDGKKKILLEAAFSYRV